MLTCSAVDRWGMTEALQNAGCEQVFGDLIYALDIPILIKRWGSLRRLIRVMTPLASQLPFSVLYPTGSAQDKAPKPNPRMEALYSWADVIAGDWQFVKKYMPEDMSGKWIITNTTTAGRRRARAQTRGRTAGDVDTAARGPLVRHQRHRGDDGRARRREGRADVRDATASCSTPWASGPTSCGFSEKS